MKKIITNYEALLISLASKGDCTAFHSLVIPYLKSDYLKLIEDGLGHSEVCARLYKQGTDLFKKFVGNNPESFDAWIKENGEKSDDSDEHFFPSNKIQADQDLFSNELHLQLQRTAYSLHQKAKNRSILKMFPISKPVYYTLLGAGILILVIAFVSVLYCTHYSIKLQVVNAANEGFSFSFPKWEAPAPVVIENKPLPIKDTLPTVKATADTVRADTVKKIRRRSTYTNNTIQNNTNSILSESDKKTEISTSPTAVKTTESQQNSSGSNESSKATQQPIPLSGDSTGRLH